MPGHDANPTMVYYTVVSSQDGGVLLNGEAAVSFTLQDVLLGSVRFSHAQENMQKPLQLYSTFDVVAEHGDYEPSRRSVMIRILPHSSLMASKPEGTLTKVRI